MCLTFCFSLSALTAIRWFTYILVWALNGTHRRMLNIPTWNKIWQNQNNVTRDTLVWRNLFKCFVFIVVSIFLLQFRFLCVCVAIGSVPLRGMHTFNIDDKMVSSVLLHLKMSFQHCNVWIGKLNCCLFDRFHFGLIAFFRPNEKKNNPFNEMWPKYSARLHDCVRVQAKLWLRSTVYYCIFFLFFEFLNA